jgi:NCAIR mutase (PurE)-related protein
MDKQYFSFYDIPELIVKNGYTRKDYDKIIKVLKKVKMSFLETKIEKQVMQRMKEFFEKKKLSNNEENDLSMDELVLQAKREAYNEDNEPTA